MNDVWRRVISRDWLFFGSGTVSVSMTRPDFTSGSEAFGRGAGRSGMSEGAAAAWEGETDGGG